MRYFKASVLILILYAKLSSATDFELSPSNKIDDIIYFSLHVKNNNGIKDIDVGLEGDANNVVIKQYYTFTCQWGEASGVRLSMDSSSADGPLLFDNIYALDSKLNIVFAKSYSRINQKWIDPVSLKNSVCKRSGAGLKNDPITKKDYVVDYESIQQGPFILKGINDVSIKYTRDDSLNLVREDVNGEVVIDTIKNRDSKSPSVRTIFFMNIGSEMNVISLVSWGGGADEGDYYKVYGYTYDKTGSMHINTTLNKDFNLSGHNTKETPFKYKNAGSIKEYIFKKYNL